MEQHPEIIPPELKEADINGDTLIKWTQGSEIKFLKNKNTHKAMNI